MSCNLTFTPLLCKKAEEYFEAARPFFGSRAQEIEDGLAPVSYTHLDVYKRQIFAISGVTSKSKQSQSYQKENKMKDTIYVPPIKIQGIKTKLVPLIKQSVIVNQNSIWIEPFMGSGVVGFNVEPNHAIFADTNPHIIEFYNQIKSGVITPISVREFLEHEGRLLEQGDDEYYYAVRARCNKDHKDVYKRQGHPR